MNKKLLMERLLLKYSKKHTQLISIFIPIFTIILILLICACAMPLRQCELLSDNSDTHFQSNENGTFSVWVDQKTWDDHFKLIDNMSWVSNPDGDRYKIKSIDKGNFRKEIKYDISIIDENSKKKTFIKNGVWSISLYFQNKDKIKIRDFFFKLSTFYYNPLLHGAPN